MRINIGNNNKFKNSNFIENADIRVATKNKDSFWKSVFVNIVSNFLWKVLSIVFSLLILLAITYYISSI